MPISQVLQLTCNMHTPLWPILGGRAFCPRLYEFLPGCNSEARCILPDQDRSLPGVAAVLLDEFHERNWDADMALALCTLCRCTARPDLRRARRCISSICGVAWTDLTGLISPAVHVNGSCH